MDPISQKTLDVITNAGKEAVSLVINKTTGDNHPEYERAVISGTAEAIKELAKSDTETAVRVYESIKIKREQRDFFNLSKILHRFATLVKTKPEEEIRDDNDFFWNTIEHAKSVSSEEMQELVAKIIAGEYSTPGSYSLHTLQTLKMLGKDELELFEKICSLLINGDEIPQDIFSMPISAKALMGELSIDFGSLQLLQSLGLFLPNDMSRPMENLEKKNFKTVYFDKWILFTPSTPDNVATLKINRPGFFGLSPVGKQLLKHLNPKANDNYFNWLKENYKIPNYKILE